MKINNPYPSFDDQLREQLASLNPAVPEGVWEAMESSLDTLNQGLQFDSLIRESVDQINIPAPEGVFQAVQSQLGSGIIGSGLSLAGKWILGSVLVGVLGTSIWLMANNEILKTGDERAVVAVQKEESGIESSFDPKNQSEPNGPQEAENTEKLTGAPAGGQDFDYSTNIRSNDRISSAKEFGTNETTNSNQPPSTKVTVNGISAPATPAKNELSPSFGFSKPDTMICFGDTYKLYLIHADNCVYDVLVNGVLIERSNAGREIFNYSAPKSGLYLIDCVVRNGERIWKKSQVLYVNALPEIKLNISDYGNGRYFFESGENKQTTWYLDGKPQSTANIHLFDALPRDHRISAYVTDKFGCKDSASLIFRNNFVFEVKELNLPNTFTPDGDGVNDVYSVEIEGTTYYQIYIFNTESQVVFESNDPKATWDGRDKFNQNRVEGGTYPCIIKYSLAGGEIQERTTVIQLIKK